MKQATLNQYSFAYNQTGQGHPLVLVHGSVSDYRTWEGQFKAFGKRYATISYSRRFHRPNIPIGPEEDYSFNQHVSDLEAFLDEITSEPVHLVGHSYGAFVCLMLACKNPGQIRTLTLAEPPVITLYVSNSPKLAELLKVLVSRPKTALALIRLGAKGIEPASAALKKGNKEQALDIFGKAVLGASSYSNLSNERKEQAKANLIKAEFLGSGFPKPDKEAIKNLHLPVLLIGGENSPAIFGHLSRSLHEMLPNSGQITISDASHNMHEDNPEGFNEAVLEFIGKNS